MWIGVLWAGVRVATWITHVGGKFRHGLLEKSLIQDRNLLKLRSLGSSCPFFLGDNGNWGQWTHMLQMLWSQG